MNKKEALKAMQKFMDDPLFKKENLSDFIEWLYLNGYEIRQKYYSYLLDEPFDLTEEELERHEKLREKWW